MTPVVGSPSTVESSRASLSRVLQVVRVLLSLPFPRLSRTRSCRVLSAEMFSGLRWMVSTTVQLEHRTVVVRLQVRLCRALVVFLRAKVLARLSLSRRLARRASAEGILVLSIV